MIDRRTLLISAGAMPLAAVSGAAVAAAPTTTPSTGQGWTADVEEFRRRQPVTARHEGVWEGVYRRYDAEGRPLGQHRSRVVIRFRPDPRGGSEIYRQSNYYFHPDGRVEDIQTTGGFDGERLRFASDRVEGWSIDDAGDPARRTCLLYMNFLKNVSWYTAGVQVYELINIADDGRHRTRMTQHLKDGRTLTRTLIDETFVTRDWAGTADWKAAPFAAP